MDDKTLLIGSSGYVGSVVARFLRDQGVSVIGVDRRDGPETDIACSHQDLPLAQIQTFRTILFFAGVSNVPEAIGDPQRAIEENVTALVSLKSKLRPNSRLIYASSGSVYSQSLTHRAALRRSSNETDSMPRPLNPYDASKVAADQVIQFVAPSSNCTGLRLGTVNGTPANPASMRPELVLNAMVYSAMSTGIIELRNPDASRAIVFTDHLASVIFELTQYPGPLPPILNVASVNLTIGEIAVEVAKVTGAKIRKLRDTPTYHFSLDTKLLASFSPKPRSLRINDVINELMSSYSNYDEFRTTWLEDKVQP